MSPRSISTSLRRKDKDDSFRLMGFGHRVYKNFDPRATIIREVCHEVLEKLADTNNPMFELARRLEEVALEDDYFVERKLYPNVDFYSGIIYRALGIPNNMFTVMFAIARTVGWVAHWMEMMSDPEQRIGRPRQIYTRRQVRGIISHYQDVDLSPRLSSVDRSRDAPFSGRPSRLLRGGFLIAFFGKTINSISVSPAVNEMSG